MYKYSATYYLGKTEVFVKLGFSPDQITELLVADGLSEKTAQGLVGTVVKGLGRAGKFLGSLGARMSTPFRQATAAGTKPGAMTRLQGWGGEQFSNLSRQFRQAKKTVGEVGLPTAIGRGMKEFGKGLVGMEGTPGLGRTAGRIGFAGSMGSMFLPSSAPPMAPATPMAGMQSYGTLG